MAVRQRMRAECPNSHACEPAFSVERDGETLRLVLSGAWTISASRALESAADALGAAGRGAARVAIDFAGVARLDTAGAWLIDKARDADGGGGAATEYQSLDLGPEHFAARGGLCAAGARGEAHERRLGHATSWSSSANGA